MYKFYPDTQTATAHIVSESGEMRISFVLKSTTAFNKLSLTDPESATEYYLGSVGEGTTYSVPLSDLTQLPVYLLKSDGTWASQMTFELNKDSIAKESDSTT